MVDGLQPDRVKPVIDVAIARFAQFQELRAELNKAKTSLAERKLVEKAKGILMNSRACGEEEAYASMRKMAMDLSGSSVSGSGGNVRWHTIFVRLSNSWACNSSAACSQRCKHFMPAIPISPASAWSGSVFSFSRACRHRLFSRFFKDL